MKIVQSIGTFTLGIVALMILIVVANLPGEEPLPSVPNGAVLVLNPIGAVMEQPPLRTPFEDASPLGDGRVYAESIHDILRAIKTAKNDSRISGLALYTNSFAGAGSAHLHEIADAIRDFKSTDKPVYAISTAYSQASYMLAAEADKVYVDKEGSAILSGYGIFPMYYNSLFEKLEATVEVFRVGKFKSAVEPYTRNDMSADAKISNGELINGLWGQYVKRVTDAREALDPASLNAAVDDIVPLLREAGGDFADMALNAGLVDQIGTRRDWRAEISETHGSDSSGETFKQINHNVYLEALGPRPTRGKEIAIITAQGVIVPGSGPVTVAASGTIVGYIREAHNDPSTAAIVLRVDSVGGSAFASEQIRQELEIAQEKGLPVIASFGPVAASGGYWIAASADKIIASPSSVTGSIGIFAVLTTYENTAKMAGVTVDGVATSELAAGFNIFKGLNATVRDVLQLSIEDGYRDFLTLVAENRNMTVEEVDEIAQGRVWLGEKALENGLVDQLGSFQDAVTAAAEAAEVESYSLRFYRDEMDPFDEFLIEVFDEYSSASASTSAPLLGDLAAPVTSLIGKETMMESLMQAAKKIEQDINIYDPHGRLILCMVCRPN